MLIVPEISLCKKTLRLEQSVPPTTGKTPLARTATPFRLRTAATVAWPLARKPYRHG